MNTKLFTLLLTICFIACIKVNAQQSSQPVQEVKIPQCKSSVRPEHLEEYRKNVAAEKNFAGLRDAALNLPVQFHVVRRSNGTGGISADDAAWELEQANAKYAPAGIELFQCSPTHFIDDDDYFNTEFDSDWEDFCGQTNPEYLITGQNNVSNVINIYFVNTDGWNWGSFPSALNNCRDWIILNIADTGTTFLLAHELGHYFNLLHTFQGYGDGEPDNEENITRNSDADCYNCGETGDYLCDTPADPNEWNSSCGWNGSGSDACDNNNFDPDPENLMSYANGCQEYFTAGQIARITFAAAVLRGYLECPYLSDCNSSWSLSADQNFMFSYQATDFITSTAKINSGVTSSYDAANYVLLKAGFFAPSGCDFHVLNEGCWGPDVFKGNETEADVKHDEITSASFRIYPNPAGNLTHLVYKGGAETYTIIIHDALGQNVFQKIVSGEVQHETEVDLSAFQKGIYFVSLNTSSGSETLPLVIQ